LILGLIAVLLIGVLPALAQEETTQPVEVRITEIGISRYPEMTLVVELRNIENLDPTQLTVLEAGEPIQSGTTTPISQTPVQVGIVLAIDTGVSMVGEPIEAAKAAAIDFIDNMRPQDLVAVVGFGDEVDIFTAFTNNPTALKLAVSQLEATGSGSRLFDAMVDSADLFARVGDLTTLERNLILLSDGGDSASDISVVEAVAALNREEVSVFAVGLEGTDFDSETLQQLTGSGVFLATPDPAQLTTLYADIQRSLDDRLVVAFTAREEAPRDVEFEVQYAGVSDSQVVSVPGFIIPASAATTLPPTYTVEAPAAAKSGLSSSTFQSIAIWTLALAVAAFVLVVGLGRNTDVVAARLGKLSQTRRFRRAGSEPVTAGDEPNFWRRVPLLNRLTSQAEEVVEKQGMLRPIANLLEQANILWRPGEVVAGALGLAAAASLGAALFYGSLVAGVVVFLALVLGIAGLLRFIASRERNRFVNQMPDTLGLIATSLRSGQSFLQALEAVASEASEPTAREYQRAVAEVRLGRPIGAAIRAIAERMDSEDFGWVVMATDIQREVGGNLAEVLDIVSETMMHRNRLRREVRALSAEGRMSAIILGGLPVFMFLFLFTSNRDYLAPLVERKVGWIMIGVALSCMLAAFAWLRKIVNIEI
jgi:tight adherence protein B